MTISVYICDKIVYGIVYYHSCKHNVTQIRLPNSTESKSSLTLVHPPTTISWLSGRTAPKQRLLAVVM